MHLCDYDLVKGVWSQCYKWDAEALWLEHWTLNRENPVLNPLAAILKLLLHIASVHSTLPQFTPHCLSSLHIASVHSTLPQFTPHCLSSLHIASVHSTLPQFTTHCLSSLHIASVHYTLPQFTPHCLSSLHIASVHSTLPQFTQMLNEYLAIDTGGFM